MPETTPYQNAYGGLYPVVILALIHFMHHLAGSTFDQFRPSLDLPTGEVERERNHFLMAPAWFGLLFLLLGLQSGVAQVMGEAGYARSLGIDVSPLMIAMGFVTLGASSVFTTYFLANTIRRLRLIILLHRKVGEVDLYHLESLRAFSRFSSVSALALLLTILANSAWITQSADDLGALLFYIVISLVAVVVFFLPLLGLRGKINAARDQRTNDLMADMDLIAAKISQAVRQDDLDRLDKLKVGMDGLMMQRDQLHKLHTWPWSTATIRAFWSAFLLPIVLWLVTRILERFI
jgi:hypothetical protein